MQERTQSGSKQPVIATVYPVNEKTPKPKKSGEYIGKDVAIGRPVPVGQYSPGMDFLPPAPYPGGGGLGIGKRKPGKYAPQGKEFDLSELRKYLEEIMGDTAYIMIPVRKKELAKYKK